MAISGFDIRRGRCQRRPQSKSAPGPSITYAEKVLALNPSAYWPLTETSGVVADNAEGTAALDGAYTGVTLNATTGPDGSPAGSWDGVNDLVDVYSPELSSLFDGAEGSVSVWAKVASAGVWTDATIRNVITFYNDGNNFIYVSKTNTDNTLQFFRKAGGGNNVYSVGSQTTTDWVQLGITWSEAANETKAYIGGVVVPGSQPASAWGVSTLDASGCKIGALTTIRLWSGNIQHAALWAGTVLTPSQMAELAVV